MADKIRATLEKLIPDLMNLQKREIFSDEDVKGIMREREKNEQTPNRDIIKQVHTAEEERQDEGFLKSRGL